MRRPGYLGDVGILIPRLGNFGIPIPKMPKLPKLAPPLPPPLPPPPPPGPLPPGPLPIPPGPAPAPTDPYRPLPPYGYPPYGYGRNYPLTPAVGLTRGFMPVPVKAKKEEKEEPETLWEVLKKWWKGKKK